MKVISRGEKMTSVGEKKRLTKRGGRSPRENLLSSKENESSNKKSRRSRVEKTRPSLITRGRRPRLQLTSTRLRWTISRMSGSSGTKSSNVRSKPGESGKMSKRLTSKSKRKRSHTMTSQMTSPSRSGRFSRASRTSKLIVRHKSVSFVLSLSQLKTQ